MNFSRRHFIKSSGIALGSLPFISLADQFGVSKTIKVGLVGCGGRGTGAVVQALAADSNVVVTALADAFQDQIDQTLLILNKKDAQRTDVPKERQFVGFDGYRALIDSGVDVVLLCSPPNFRPDHLAYAVEAGKHIFCEKPVAVDIPGLKRVMESVRIAKEKKLNLVSGFCFRYSTPNREIMQRVQNGDIGEVKSVTTFRYGGELTLKERKNTWTDFEYQLRNWYYFQRYASDLIVEQSIHSVDYMNWIMGNKLPKSVSATGGRQSRSWELLGNTYDHFAVEYDYGDGVKGMHFSRQQNGTESRNSVEVNGTKGFVDVNIMKNYNIHGDKAFEYGGKINNMYQTQHDELMAAISGGKLVNDGDFMVNSTLLAIWGKLAAYTGKRLSYEQIMASTEELGPHSEGYNWSMSPDVTPIAQPGFKPFV
ncbi:Gfo/Idh/MocA family protein [Sphingobacterium yanglingense]|uniref:Putative dehydrogenase n=1 Tax=Sphingobacterium yanglingense TaxID=1437280 RepID=A0A4R6WI14_9SPHI|nr:Gfo/Idh/MocA family oxidoreductase [Sphingobacterium yanglingense]TDQ79890.1 putative dehydrogenase [Sphingobacterium yanglingense]